MRTATLATLALLAISFGGCETTAEKSAQLARRAKRVTLSEQGLTIARPSSDVAVVGSAVVHDAERAAAAVTLRNRSSRALRAVPIAITVKDASGKTLFQNNAPGLESALVSVPSIPAHGTVVWVDDQLPSGGAPTSVSAKVGEAPAVATVPTLAVSQSHVGEDPADGVVASGVVANRSKVAQSGLVVFTVALRGDAIVAAGRAIVSELAAGASAPFQASLVGQAAGGRLEVFAPAATFG